MDDVDCIGNRSPSVVLLIEIVQLATQLRRARAPTTILARPIINKPNTPGSGTLLGPGVVAALAWVVAVAAVAAVPLPVAACPPVEVPDASGSPLVAAARICGISAEAEFLSKVLPAIEGTLIVVKSPDEPPLELSNAHSSELSIPLASRKKLFANAFKLDWLSPTCPPNWTAPPPDIKVPAVFWLLD